MTIATALAWATEPRNAAPNHRYRRLGVVRCFARHLHAFDLTCEIPPTDLLPARSHRPTPYVYPSAEIAAPPPAATTQAMISLIAAS